MLEHQESPTATVALNRSNRDTITLVINGNAALAGTQTLATASGFAPKSGTSFTVLTAKAINGKFSNPEGQVTDKNGNRFVISYANNAVTLTAL